MANHYLHFCGVLFTIKNIVHYKKHAMMNRKKMATLSIQNRKQGRREQKFALITRNSTQTSDH